MARTKNILLMMCLLSVTAGVQAQPFSYIYIQGDKDLPFYVKMEGQMQPRYGKNYCIISELNAGVVHLEVLFQQHALPPKKFTVRVPENGFRGFLLSKKDTAYALYDLMQQRYLGPGEE